MAATKRPSFQFYPRDWMDDKPLRRCSPAARALWVDMMCLAHQGEPYGHLRDTVSQFEPKFIAQETHMPLVQVKKLIAELEEKAVFSRTPDGTIYSRRMVRDEELRIKRAGGGADSLNNPNVPRPKDTLKDIHEGYPSNASEGILPSAREGILGPSRTRGRSSSSSSSSSAEQEFGNFGADDWAERLYARHPKKRNKPLVERVVVELFGSGGANLLSEIDRVHALWCDDPDWQGINAKFVPSLDKWLADEGWTAEPTSGKSKPEESIYPEWKPDYEVPR